MSYGVDNDTWLQDPAAYVIRLLNGEKIADLPVLLAPTRLAINLNAARAIGVEFPLIIYVRADVVIE